MPVEFYKNQLSIKHKEVSYMKLTEKIKATKIKKNKNLIEIMKLVEPNSGRRVSLELVSDEYKMSWYKKRLRVFAESMGLELSFEGDKAILTFKNSVQAELVRGLFKKKGTN